ncbi:MAG TPA: translocation/assembly module TamB domain-containing protein [Fimbriimonadales bacterium]|nr:translocation/assembly module TamB domain-containing protein [Fimbriimonadales bacterium]
MKRAWGPGIWILFALPPIAMAIWAAFYLYGFLRYFESPLHDIAFTYRGQRGPIEARADVVQLNWRDGRIDASGVQLNELDTPAFAEAQRLTVRIPLPWVRGRRAYFVDVDRGNFFAERYPNGAWSFQDVVPYTKEKKPTETAFVIRAKNSRFDFFDRWTNTPHRWHGSIASLSVDGTEKASASRFDAGVDGVGPMHVNLDIGPEGVEFVQILTPNMNMMPLKRYFADWRTFKSIDWLHNWTAAMVSYSGAMTVQPIKVNGHPEWRVRGDAVVDAAKLSAFGRLFDTASFDGAFTEQLVTGDFAAAGPGIRGSGKGTLQYLPKAQGQFEGKLYAASEAIARKYFGDLMPRELRFSAAEYSGKFGFGEKLLAMGDIKARSAKYQDYSATGLSAKVVSNGNLLRLTGAKGHIFGAPANSEILMSFGKKPTIRGFLTSQDVDITQLPGVPKKNVLRGRADVQVLFSGTPTHPNAALRANGNALLAFETKDERRLEPVDFGLAGKFDDGFLHIDAGEVVGKHGILRGSGNLGIKNKNLDLDVAAGSIDLSAFPGSNLSGFAFGDLQVHGTIANPRVAGLVEAYSLNMDDYSLPFVSAQVSYSNDIIRAEQVNAQSGVTLITGGGSLDLAHDNKIAAQGSVVDIGLGQFTDETVQGIARGTWLVSGTLANPLAEADLTADSLVADRVEVKNAHAKAKWANKKLTLEAASAEIGGGTIKATGGWASQGESRIEAHVEGVQVGVFDPYLEGSAKLGGLMGGVGQARFEDGRLVGGLGNLKATDLVLNGEPVGNGDLTASVENRVISFQAGAGSLEGYYVIDHGRYDLDTKTLDASLNVLDQSVSDALRLTAAALEDQLSPEQRQAMRELDGTFTLAAKVSAQKQPDGWKVQAGSADLAAQDLVFEGREVGKFEAAVQKDADRYLFTKAALFDGPASFRLAENTPNYIDEAGKLALDGEFYNIDLSWLKNIDPTLGAMSGTADVSFLAEGEAKSPLITATLSTNNLKYNDFSGEVFAGPFYVREGLISGQPFDAAAPKSDVGFIRLKDLEAVIKDVSIPFHYPGTIARDEPISARIEVPQKEISDIHEFLGVVADETKGTLDGGEFSVSGTLDDIRMNGSLSASAERIKFEAFDTPLSNAKANLSLEGPTLKFTANAESAEGGLMSLFTSVDLNEMSVQPGSFVNLTDFAVRQGFGTATVAQGTLNTKLDIEGSVTEPRISGTVHARNGSLRVSGEFPQAEAASALPVNPYFDVKLDLTEARISNGPLDAMAHGSGTIAGQLAGLEADMNFDLDSGNISLPTARVRFEKGGKATFKYSKDWRGLSEATLFVDLNATTRVTADAGYGPQRYSVEMHITGDLLSDEDLTIVANSDPPDLSQSQILAILGQKQLFENVAAVGMGDFNEQLKNLLASVAAPALIGQLTRQFEQALGLDYLSLDFSPAGFGGITVAKTLGNGFTLEYRRVLEQFALVGESLEEVRLTYRLPTNDPILGRLTLGLAASRDGILKATLAYSKRF